MEKELYNKINDIALAWRKLKEVVVRDSEFNFEYFKKTFDETYVILRPFSTQTHIDKQIIRIIFSVYDFVNTRSCEINAMHAAATTLTERMLKHCVANTTADNELSNLTTIYVLETQEDIELDFGDVDTSIKKLITLFQSNF